MALQVQVDRAAFKPVMLSSSSSRSTKQFVVSVAVDRRYNNPAALTAGGRLSLRVKASLDSTATTATTTPTLGKVTEVNKDTFWPIVEAAGEKAVVLDMYTQWCGPCKVIAPKFEELSAKYLDVVFLKLDCNQDNRPLAKELGIKVVPTFKVLKSGKIVKEVTGAKIDDLIAAIECARWLQHARSLLRRRHDTTTLGCMAETW